MSTTTRGTDSREAILDAAADLIREKGLAGLSISEIISAAGTSTGAIYHHFANKQAIIEAVAIRAIAQPMEIALAEQHRSPSELFVVAASRVTREAEVAQLLLQIWAGAAADPELKAALADRAAGLHLGVMAHIKGWLDERGLGDRALAITTNLVGLVLGYAVQRWLFPDFDETGYVESAVSLLDGVAQDR